MHRHVDVPRRADGRHAATDAAKDLVHQAGIDSELAGPSTPPVTLFVDNKALVDVAYNPEHVNIMTRPCKHIARKEFYVRETVEDFSIIVRYVNTTDNLADFFTKWLPPKVFFALRDRIMNITNPNNPAR